MLRGPELLAKVKELGSMPKSDVVRACGYISPRKDGAERLNYTAFYEALLEAKGMSFGSAGESPGRRDSVGRKLSYIAKVHFNGNLLVGKAYTSALGLKPGDEFDIKLERKGIRLTPKRLGDMMPAAPASVSEEESEAPRQPPASAPVSPAPFPGRETPTSAAPPAIPVASPSAPPVHPVAPAPIPSPVAAPAAPPAPDMPPAPQPAAPVAAAPAPTAPPTTVQQPAPQPTPQTSQVDRWQDSLRKLEALDQSSRPERWDA